MSDRCSTARTGMDLNHTNNNTTNKNKSSHEKKADDVKGLENADVESDSD